MDIISQLQDEVDHIASLLFNHVGTLQRDTPPAPLAKRGAKDDAREGAPQPEPLAAAVVQAAKVLDELIAACPPTADGEQAQMARIQELQNESDRLGDELAAELEAAEADREVVDAMFLAIADSCLPVKSNSGRKAGPQIGGVQESRQLEFPAIMDVDPP